MDLDVIIGVPLLALAIWGLVDNARTVLLALHERPDARGAVLSGRERIHPGVRPDAQRQPRARLAVPARRLLRLGRGRSHRELFLAIAAGFASPRWSGSCCRSRVPLHAGPELRQTMVHDRHFDLLAESHAVGLSQGGEIYSFDPPRAIIPDHADGVVGKLSAYRLVVLGIASWTPGAVAGSCQPHAASA
jgi:hypothetical protein